MNTKRRQILLYSALGLTPSWVRAACRITEPNSMGPFYRRNALFRARLSSTDEPGQLLQISGKVLDGQSCNPLAGAIVDVWHANHEGRYYDVGVDANSAPEQFRLRGRMRTNDQGGYQFSTILPGSYGSRPKHIHYVVYHQDAEPLVTQLYFAGDPYLERDSLVRESLVRQLHEGEDNSLTGSFDVVLQT